MAIMWGIFGLLLGAAFGFVFGALLSANGEEERRMKDVHRDGG